MPKVVVFEQVSLDGYFTDASGDMSWAHRADPEWNAFAADNASGGGALLFGRVTYEMMASFWPTPAAEQVSPVVARHMNALPKTVFSRTLREAAWSNTRVVPGGLAEEVRRLKRGQGPDIAVMGSGSVVAALTQEGLIDEYKIVVVPIVLGRGKTLFEGVTRRVALRRTKTRAFENGNVLACYEPGA